MVNEINEIAKKLAAEFPKEIVSWRAQSVSKAGDKALALAYIDARDVMRRLDEVVGIAGWQDSYFETAAGRVICTISIMVEGKGWIQKSDGAGETQVEADKGALSDAFKRAAVKWGIGRYLYDVDTPWVPIDQYKKFTVDPWTCIRGNKPPLLRAKEGIENVMSGLRSGYGDDAIPEYNEAPVDLPEEKPVKKEVKPQQESTGINLSLKSQKGGLYNKDFDDAFSAMRYLQSILSKIEGKERDDYVDRNKALILRMLNSEDPETREKGKWVLRAAGNINWVDFQKWGGRLPPNEVELDDDIPF